MNNGTNSLAGIEYAGVAGSSLDCQNAILRYLQFGDKISRARVLSCSGDHCFLLTVGAGEDLVAVKSGFGSGYIGEGSRTFSYVLQLLKVYKVEIEEYDVTADVIERVDNSALTVADIKKLDATLPIRPTRWYDYIFEQHWESNNNRALWEEFPHVIPFTIIDKRIMDLAIAFWENPDEKLITGYRRLEDIVRRRTNLDEPSAKLFSSAYNGADSKLYWADLSTAEHAGRVSLFTGAYMAYRNPRAHQELDTYSEDYLTEFLLLNHLYRLEKESTNRVPQKHND